MAAKSIRIFKFEEIRLTLSKWIFSCIRSYLYEWILILKPNSYLKLEEPSVRRNEYEKWMSEIEIIKNNCIYSLFFFIWAKWNYLVRGNPWWFGVNSFLGRFSNRNQPLSNHHRIILDRSKSFKRIRIHSVWLLPVP